MRAKTIAEVVAGEMSYKGDPVAQWSDALGIASTIANRAKAYGVSPEDIVSAPGQYQAYGKALPPGVGAAHIARAQKALDTIAKYGPVTAATHYALPANTKNIKGWSSFKQVDQVPGSHVFAIDPQMRAIRTATGVVRAQPNAFETVMNNAKVGALAVARSVAHAPQAVAAMTKQGFDVATGRVVGRNTFPAAPGLPGVDQVSGLKGLKGKMSEVKGVTIHHTGKMGPNATVKDVIDVLNTRKEGQFGAHFVVDPQGVVHQIAPIGTKVSHMKNDKRGLNLGNQNMIGIEVMAADDKHVNAAQVAGTTAFLDKLNDVAPQIGTNVYGHGFLANDPRHKQPTEGQTITKAWDALQATRMDPGIRARTTMPPSDAPASSPRPAVIPEDPRAAALRSLPPAPTPSGALSTGLDTLAPQQPTTGPLVNPAAAQATPEQIGLSRAMMAGMDSPAYISRNIPPARPQQGPLAPRPQQGPPMPTAAPTPTGPAAGAPGPPVVGGSQPVVGGSQPVVGGSQPVVGGSPPLVGGAPKQGRVGTGPFTQAPPQASPQRFGPTTAPPARSIASAPASIASTSMQAQAPGQFTLGNATMTPSLTEAIKAGPAAIPPDPGQAARLSLPPTEKQPSLAEVAAQSAPTLAEPTVVADRPVKEVVQTIKTTKPAPTIGPVQTVAPAAPREIGGLLGTVRDLSMATPFGRMARSLAGLAGSVPNPKSFDYGTGAQAIGDALSGATQSKPGAVSYSKSTPGYSIKSLGNGMVEKTNQFGVKSYERVGTPGSGIFSGQAQPGGLLGGFGLSGVGPAIGGFFNAMNSPMGNMGSGWGNTANIGGTQMGYAGPWGAGTPTGLGGTMANIGQGISNAFGGGGGRGWGNTANVGPSAMGYAGPWGGGGASSSGSATGGAGGGSSANKGGKKK